jgi:FixJ family two-component response regulator
MQNRSREDSIVYIVDDDLDVREALKSLFQSVGLKSEAFETTADFLTTKLSVEPSCLILDVRLPGLSGLDFQTELARAQINIPVVFITGHGDIPMSVKAMKGGAVEFLSKPVREQDLLDAVRVALDRAHASRASGKKVRDLRERYHLLSVREQQVMSLVCAGLMNKQAAAKIGISEITVKVHRHNVMKKLGAKSLPDLVRMADMLDASRATQAHSEAGTSSNGSPEASFP